MRLSITKHNSANVKLIYVDESMSENKARRLARIQKKQGVAQVTNLIQTTGSHPLSIYVESFSTGFIPVWKEHESSDYYLSLSLLIYIFSTQISFIPNLFIYYNIFCLLFSWVLTLSPHSNVSSFQVNSPVDGFWLLTLSLNFLARYFL